MKKLIILLSLIISLLSCKKEDNLGPHIKSDKIPGTYFGRIAADSKGNIWFESSEIDTAVHMPAYSSYLPMKIYLTKLQENSYEIYDNKFMGASEMIADKNDNLWFLSGNKIYLLANNKYTEIFNTGSDDSYFVWLTKDQENNIWAGGWNAPLLKITLDPEIKVNSISGDGNAANTTAACFDKNNNLWTLLSNQQIGMRDSQGRWTVYTPDNSNLPYESFWCITCDKDNNIWAGTGYFGTGINLMKFNGNTWESVTIKDDKGTEISGTVRHLYSDNNKIWIITEFSKGGAFYSDYVITYDGSSWNRIYSIPTDDGIADVEFDFASHRALVGTLNKGLFEVGLE